MPPRKCSASVDRVTELSGVGLCGWKSASWGPTGHQGGCPYRKSWLARKFDQTAGWDVPPQPARDRGAVAPPALRHPCLTLAGGVRGTGADTGLVDTESRPCGRGAGHPRIPHSLTTRVSPLRAGRGFGMSAQVRVANLTCDVRGVLYVFWWWAMASTGRGGTQTGPSRGRRAPP